MEVNMSDAEQNEELDRAISAKIIQQIDYYFSDFNLNNKTYLRNILATTKGLTIDQLLTFKAINKTINGDRDRLISILERDASRFESAQYFATDRILCRSAAKPFEHDKRYLRRHSSSIIYCYKFSAQPPVSVEELKRRFSSFAASDCFVRPIKRSSSTIQSALIAFENETIANRILESIDRKHVLRIENGECENEQNSTGRFRCLAMSYAEYEKCKSKRHQKKKQKVRLEKAIANLSICDDDDDDDDQDTLDDNSGNNNNRKSSSSSWPLFSENIAKRTLYFHCDTESRSSFEFGDLKTHLAGFGVTFVWRIDKSIPVNRNEDDYGHETGDYFILFRNRCALNQFLDTLDARSAQGIDLWREKIGGKNGDSKPDTEEEYLEEAKKEKFIIYRKNFEPIRTLAKTSNNSLAIVRGPSSAHMDSFTLYAKRVKTFFSASKKKISPPSKSTRYKSMSNQCSE